MARIHRRSNGTWEVVVELGRDLRTGKRERRTFTVRGTKKQAESAAAVQEAAIAGGTFVDPSKEAVEEFLRRWLRDYVEPSLALRTQVRYRQVIEYDLVPYIGKLPLQKLRPMHVVALEQRLRREGNRRTGGGLGPAAVQKVHSVLHRAMNHAVRWQLLPINPVSAIDRPPVPKTEIRVLTPDQARLLLRTLRGNPCELPLRVALFCGLRLSELLALRWRDIDWDRGLLTVRQALDLPVADGTPQFKETKTHRAERPVSLPTQLLTELREHRTSQLEGRLASSTWTDRDLVFTNDRGDPVLAVTLRKYLYRALAEADLPRVRLHGLRHSMATLMLAAREHPKVVSERMGHATVAFTLATYSHVLPGMHDMAAQRLANALDLD
ncbi:MAG: site-specific integrase [Candidatus Dormibacteria bacterium]